MNLIYAKILLEALRSGASVHEVNLFCDLEKMATFVFVCERWPRSWLSPDAEFARNNKIFPNTSVCQVNCLQMKAFLNQGTTVFKNRNCVSLP